MYWTSLQRTATTTRRARRCCASSRQGNHQRAEVKKERDPESAAALDSMVTPLESQRRELQEMVSAAAEALMERDADTHARRRPAPFYYSQTPGKRSRKSRGTPRRSPDEPRRGHRGHNAKPPRKRRRYITNARRRLIARPTRAPEEPAARSAGRHGREALQYDPSRHFVRSASPAEVPGDRHRPVRGRVGRRKRVERGEGQLVKQAGLRGHEDADAPRPPDKFMSPARYSPARARRGGRMWRASELADRARRWFGSRRTVMRPLATM